MKNCNKIRTDIISDNINAELEQHLAECEPCRDLYQNINNTMAILDLDAPVPEGLAARIMERKDVQSMPKVRRLNFSSIVQLAAAIMFGIFIGHQFGKIASKNSGQIKKDPIDQYLEAHHFTVSHADFKSPSIYINN